MDPSDGSQCNARTRARRENTTQTSRPHKYWQVLAIAKSKTDKMMIDTIPLHEIEDILLAGEPVQPGAFEGTDTFQGGKSGRRESARTKSTFLRDGKDDSQAAHGNNVEDEERRTIQLNTIPAGLNLGRHYRFRPKTRELAQVFLCVRTTYLHKCVSACMHA